MDLIFHDPEAGPKLFFKWLVVIKWSYDKPQEGTRSQGDDWAICENTYK